MKRIWVIEYLSANGVWEPTSGCEVMVNQSEAKLKADCWTYENNQYCAIPYVREELSR